MIKLKTLSAGLLALVIASSASAAAFVNGGFEDGNTNGWTVGTTMRNGNLSALVPSNYLNGATGRSAIVGSGLDPVLGGLMANTVYAGNSAYRVEDTTWGGYLSVISQTVTNYTDSNIYFAWMAVLDGAHTAQTAAGMKLELIDQTTNETIISRIYSAVPGNVDARFSNSEGYYYTPVWQIEQLTIDTLRQGHDFVLTVLATDCDPTGHGGWVYLDGFGAAPPVDVPEPTGLALVAAALLAAGAARRRKNT